MLGVGGVVPDIDRCINGFHTEQLSGGAGALVEGALQFHKQCGKQIEISPNGQTARRQK